MFEPLRIELLGGLRVTHGHRVITRFRTQKTASLLAYLAYFLQRSHPREVLVDLLWPESGVDTGRHNLSVALSSLRQQLEPPGIPDGAVLVTERFSVRLDPVAVTTDVGEFEALLHSASDAGSGDERIELLARAVALYQGDLLPGFYDDWVPPESNRMRILLLQSLEQLALHLEQEAQFERALSYAVRAVTVDPLREEAHRIVMKLHAAMAEPSAALRHYEELTAVLKRELDALPSVATRTLAAEIANQVSREDESCVGVWVDGCVDEQAVTPIQPHTHPTTHPPTSALAHDLEPVGGAVPLGSPFYVVRSADREFRQAIERGDSIVLVKGARQVGKTSLLARELQQAREAGARVVFTDFQLLSDTHLASAEALFQGLGAWIAEQLELNPIPPTRGREAAPD